MIKNELVLYHPLLYSHSLRCCSRKDFMSPFLGFRPGTRISSARFPAAVRFATFCLRGLAAFFLGSGWRTGPWPASRRLFRGLGFALGFFTPAGFFAFAGPQRH